MASVLIPEKLYKKLEMDARKRGISVDELIVEALNPKTLNSNEKADYYLKLHEKYLRDADEFLAKEDYAQASEKLWGASEEIVKAVAASRGLDIKSHGELHEFVTKLWEETRDPQIRTLWLVATTLHQNFYEAWLPSALVMEAAEDVKKFSEKVKGLLPQGQLQE